MHYVIGSDFLGDGMDKLVGCAFHFISDSPRAGVSKLSLIDDVFHLVRFHAATDQHQIANFIAAWIWA